MDLAPTDAPQVLIVTGMSGAGRSSAAKILEDLGYTVIDNLPPQLLRTAVQAHDIPEAHKHLSVVIDSRGGLPINELREAIIELEREGIVTRIVFLDANYSYSDEVKHGDKLLAWLARDERHRLIVIAYDDREVVFNGKKAIGPDGGTFRATGRMTSRLGRDRELTESRVGPFLHTRDKSGQVQCFVHTNPENKILHTALVGDMNGLVHALTLGTDHEEKWGQFGGPRAYEKWIQAEPSKP